MPRLSTVWTISGAFSLLLGFLAILNPLVASVAAVTLAALGFLITGILQAVAAFGEPGWRDRALPLLLAGVMIVLAVVLFRRPDLGATVFLGVVGTLFMLSGIAKLAWAFVRRDEGLLWPAIVSGALSVLLAILILTDLGARSMQLLGLLVGVELMLNGMVLLAAGGVARRVRARVEEKLRAHSS